MGVALWGTVGVFSDLIKSLENSPAQYSCAYKSQSSRVNRLERSLCRLCSARQDDYELSSSLCGLYVWSWRIVSTDSSPDTRSICICCLVGLHHWWCRARRLQGVSPASSSVRSFCQSFEVKVEYYLSLLSGFSAATAISSIASRGLPCSHDTACRVPVHR